jgi:hypothetical protein
MFPEDGGGYYCYWEGGFGFQDELISYNQEKNQEQQDNSVFFYLGKSLLYNKLSIEFMA